MSGAGRSDKDVTAQNGVLKDEEEFARQMEEEVSEERDPQQRGQREQGLLSIEYSDVFWGRQSHLYRSHIRGSMTALSVIQPRP